MAHQAVKPYSFLMYFLAIIAFFFLGLVYAGITEAGKGQMLAGGAIVFGYGVMGALIGLILSLIAAFRANRSLIIKLNIILTLIIVTSFTYFYINYQKRQQEKLKDQPHKQEQPALTPTSPAVTFDTQTNAPIAMLFHSEITNQTEPIMGLGMFTPNLHSNKTLFFYGNITPGKSVQEHIPTDSITFKPLEYGGFDIATAPPWLVPDHMKLDYDILYFKVKSISHDFIEVIVNTTNNKTIFVDRNAGKLQYWPEFLLGVHSVEFIDKSTQKVHSRHFETSSMLHISFSFMKPTKIQQNWMYVALLNDSFAVVGKGWIQWKNENNLLIRYSLLS